MSSGALELVNSGGTADAITVQSGAEIVIAAGANVGRLTLSAGGVALFESAGQSVAEARRPMLSGLEPVPTASAANAAAAALVQAMAGFDEAPMRRAGAFSTGMTPQPRSNGVMRSS